jgi:A/G-specific adenine glycosylase
MPGRLLLLSPAKIRAFRHGLLSWYDQHRRDLPWRRDRDPYRVWVSEIMLQQTRVAAVLEHYARFLRRFPAVQTLAAAREASVLAAWGGLGYYHRARRMHQAAKLIARERAGVFPPTAEAWSELPGIGRYTAAAIASISFGEPIAVVDGNVERVLLRLFGEAAAKGVPWQQAEALLDRDRPGDFNQAMMELGATVCTPRAPQCLLCPLYAFCRTRGVETSRPQAARHSRQVAYAVVRRDSALLLIQRPPDASLMAGMWELPALDPALLDADIPLLRVRHSITNTDYQVTVFARASAQLHDCATAFRWFTPAQCRRLPLTGLTRKILRLLPLESNPAPEVSKH